MLIVAARDGGAQPVSAGSLRRAALAISVLLAVLVLWYYRLYVAPPVAAGYGPLRRRGAMAVGAAVLSVLAMVGGVVGGGSRADDRLRRTR